jgi:hypothetical protein
MDTGENGGHRCWIWETGYDADVGALYTEKTRFE